MPIKTIQLKLTEFLLYQVILYYYIFNFTVQNQVYLIIFIVVLTLSNNLVAEEIILPKPKIKIEGLSENLFPIPCIKVPRKLPTDKTKTGKAQNKQSKKKLKQKSILEMLQ